MMGWWKRICMDLVGMLCDLEFGSSIFLGLELLVGV